MFLFFFIQLFWVTKRTLARLCVTARTKGRCVGRTDVLTPLFANYDKRPNCGTATSASRNGDPAKLVIDFPENTCLFYWFLLQNFLFPLVIFPVTEPIISSAPENVTANIHDDLALSCEARGYPIPSLIWEFESAATGKKTKLPGMFNRTFWQQRKIQLKTIN